MSNKPNISRRESEDILLANQTTDKLAIIAIRGYYANSFGKRGENDRGVYDDAIIIISARKFETFRANTDPSVYRKHIATMKTGVHRYYKGKHKNRYWALRLVGEQVTVTRDGESGDKIGVALNIHKGGNRTTGSEGCQTLMPADWDDFIELVYDEMDFYGQKTVPYVLIDEKDRRSGVFKMPHITGKDFSLDDREIDNLLIRFDKDESAALPTVSNQQSTPAEKPALIPLTPENVSQPQTSCVSPQPIQHIWAGTAEQLSVPSNDGYLTGVQAKIEKAQDYIGTAMSAGDQVKEVMATLNENKDSKKSLWTIISQTFLQIFWAIFGVFAGIPREVWLVVAVIVAGITFYYLYRQITLGKIRETARLKILDVAASLK
jgi:hypothetical protein